MSVLLGEEPSRGEGVPRPTEHQLRMAEVRARTTGESIEHVLSVFMGLGRHGEAPAVAGPEFALADPDLGPQLGSRSGSEADEAEWLAPVIPLSRARGTR